MQKNLCEDITLLAACPPSCYFCCFFFVYSLSFGYSYFMLKIFFRSWKQWVGALVSPAHLLPSVYSPEMISPTNLFQQYACVLCQFSKILRSLFRQEIEFQFICSLDILSLQYSHKEFVRPHLDVGDMYDKTK